MAVTTHAIENQSVRRFSTALMVTVGSLSFWARDALAVATSLMLLLLLLLLRER